MKLNIKKLSILGLAGIFLLSVMLCCCFTDVVEAEESAPSCHSTTNSSQGHDASQSDDNCDCMVKGNFLARNAPPIKAVAASSFDLGNIFMPHSAGSEIFQNPALILTTQQSSSPPVCLLPIYIQNSNLQL